MAGYRLVIVGQVLLEADAVSIGESGVAKLTLPALGKSANAPNAAPSYHCGDKARLLTALATEGVGTLSEALASSHHQSPVHLGVSYAEFALTHLSHFLVMFQPSFLRDEYGDLKLAQRRAQDFLAARVQGALGHGADDQGASRAAWSIVHDYATLVLSGAITEPDRLAEARRVAGHLDLDKLQRAVGPDFGIAEFCPRLDGGAKVFEALPFCCSISGGA